MNSKIKDTTPAFVLYKYRPSEKFLELENHPIYRASYNRLTRKDHAICLAFLEDIEELPYDEFQNSINSWHQLMLDQPSRKNEVHHLLCAVSPRIRREYMP